MALLQSDIINLFKFLTLFVYGIAVYRYDLFDNLAAWMLIGTHGTYGMLWVGKTVFGFGDKSFEVPATIKDVIVISTALSLYWLPIYLVVQNRPVLPPFLAGLITATFGLGVFFHFVSDLHKHVFLEYRAMLKEIKAKLPETQTDLVPTVTFLKTHLWALSLNPNYFGELLIYLSFSMCAMSIWPFVFLAVMIVGAWIPNMKRKDASLSRFPDYVTFRKSTSKLIPFIW